MIEQDILIKKNKKVSLEEEKYATILIVDDEPLVRNKIASLLETQGYEVEIAVSSQMARQMCKKVVALI